VTINFSLNGAQLSLLINEYLPQVPQVIVASAFFLTACSFQVSATFVLRAVLAVLEVQIEDFFISCLQFYQGGLKHGINLIQKPLVSLACIRNGWNHCTQNLIHGRPCEVHNIRSCTILQHCSSRFQQAANGSFGFAFDVLHVQTLHQRSFVMTMGNAQ
jgi:hypothetical protein